MKLPKSSESVPRLEELIRNARALLDDAEHSVRDQKLLLKVSAELGASLPYEATLQKVAQLVVADFADWCFVDLVGPDGRVHDVAVAHRDRAKEDLARSLVRQLPQLPSAPHGVVRVLRTRETELFASQADEPPPLGHYLGVEYPDALRELGARSYVCVPLLARDKALGAITYVRGPDSPGYTRQDLDLANELGLRSAIAIDNAMLYRTMSDAIRQRDEVMAILSHDLRGFLSAVRANTNLLLKKAPSPDERDSLERLDRAASRMNHLVEDVLDISRIESGALPLDLRARDADALVSDALDAIWGKARAKEIELEPRIPPGLRVMCDPTRIHQVLTNLLDNAIKFTPNAGRIRIKAEADESHAVFSIVDSGPGIAEEELPHVFDRFWQGRHHGRAGAGLGLAIVKGIVEAHGGQVTIESKKGEGTTGRFTLPLERRPPTVREPEGAKVLLADDDDVFRNAVKATLVENGYEVIEARDGAAALEELAMAADGRRQVADIVVLDIRMPGCSGLGVLNAMSHLRRRPPTLLVTGFKDSSVNILAERLGASGVLFKPVDADRVLQAVRDLQRPK